MTDTAPMALRPSAHYADKLAAIQSFREFCQGTLSAPASPLEIFLEASNVCDMKCTMCREFSALHPNRPAMLKSTRRGFLDLDVIERLEPMLRRALLVHCFGYGEATLHPKFRAVIDLVSRYEPLIDFFTHGMHLDEDTCRFLVDRNVYKVTISLSGTSSAVYDRFYIGGDYDRVLAGIRRLAEAKKAAGSRFPLIEINSLSFREHVETFETFVENMAGLGVDIVHLKQLQHIEVVPQLYPHISIMRPWIEGEIVDRAIATGTRLGIVVNADQYRAMAVPDEEAYRRRHDDLLAQAAPELPELSSRTPRSLSPDEDKTALRAKLDIGSGEPPGFTCMEPFKTLYLTRNGTVKPCCFARPGAWHLGNVIENTSDDIWNGAAFETVRTSIIDGDYPMDICSRCLHKQLGPKDHFARQMIDTYLDWHDSRFGPILRQALDRSGQPVLQDIAAAPGGTIAARHRNPPPASWDDIVAAMPDDAVQGYVERVHDEVVGWAWSPALPDGRLPITIWDDDAMPLARGVADVMRDDLAEANKGDGGHGFRIALPSGRKPHQGSLSVSIGNDPARRRLPHL